MVAFQNIPLGAIKAMYPDPLVARAAGDEPVLENRMDGRRGGRVGEREAGRLISVWQCGDEGDCLSGRDDEAVGLGGEFHGRYRSRERNASRQTPSTEIPPSVDSRV